MISVDIIFKIAAIGIIVAVLNQVLIVNQILRKSDKDEIATLVTLVGLVIVLLLVVDMLGDLFATLRDVFGLYG